MGIKELKYINNNSSSLVNNIPSSVSGVKERKRIVNKFDIGKNQIESSGRLTTTDVNTAQFASTPAYSYDKLASTYKSQILPTVFSGVGNIGTLALSIFNEWTSPAQAAASAAGSSTASAASTATGTAASTSGSASGAAAGTAGSTAATAGLSALGYVTSAVGFGMGLADMIGTANDYERNRIKDTDMLQGSSMSTQSKYGRLYSQYGGFDESGMIKATLALNTADTTHMSMAGAGAGMAAGAGVGAAIGGYGGPIGAGIGLLLGGLGGLFWGQAEARERMRKVRLDAYNTNMAEGGWNIQQEAEAASLGLRDMNRASSRNVTTGILNADKGKNPGQSMNKFSLGKIYTPQGITFGEQRGLASPDEGEIDMITGETLYNGSPSFKVKDKRADIVPVGTPGKADGGLNGDYFDHFVAIPGHGELADGITPADLSRPHFKENEQIKDMIASVESGKGDKNTKKYMLNRLYKRYSDNSNAIANIVRAQLNMPLFSCGKNAKYALGKEFIMPTLNYLTNIPYYIKARNIVGEKGPLPKAGATNKNEDSALRILASLGYDPSADLADLVRVGKQNRYNIMNTGGLSAGQKAALSSNSNIQLGAQRRAILADAYNKNAAFKSAYANALMQAGEQQAGRDFNSSNINATNAIKQNESYVENRLATDVKIPYTGKNQWLNDITSALWYNDIINLWDKHGGQPFVAKNTNVADTFHKNIRKWNPVISGTVPMDETAGIIDYDSIVGNYISRLPYNASGNIVSPGDVHYVTPPLLVHRDGYADNYLYNQRFKLPK